MCGGWGGGGGGKAKRRCHVHKPFEEKGEPNRRCPLFTSLTPTTARQNQLTVSRERMRKRQMCKRLGPVPVRCSKYPLLLLLLLLLSAMFTMNQQHTVGLNIFYIFIFYIRDKIKIQ